ncbi:hypothetical protein M0R72_06175 [Candidatus Pacearchaeota archaeon]|nr:hypothetical protein [Candidatus Pacearchaeota archaeon]
MAGAKRGDARRISRLAGYGRAGPIRVNPHVPKTYKGIQVRKRLVTHEKVERALRIKEGLTYLQAHARALKAEHAGLTKKQVQIYEGILGAVARHYPYYPKKKGKK